MVFSPEALTAQLIAELDMLWAGHRSVGLDGFMQLYTRETQDPWRTKETGLSFWFGPGQSQEAAEFVLSHYNYGKLPNAPLLLCPVVHALQEDGSYTALGSGVLWCTALCMGVDRLNAESTQRIGELGALYGFIARGDNERAGLKVVCFSGKAEKPIGNRHETNGMTVEGCRELYDLVHMPSEPYAAYYMLSGVAYLSTHGLFVQPDFAQLLPDETMPEAAEAADALVQKLAIDTQLLHDSAYCWNAYEHHHSLYLKFGTNPADVSDNLRFFNLVARDIELFDATGPMRKDLDETFQFIVPGWIPSGSVTLLAASGGTGKSSLAHYLAVLGSIDYEPGETPPTWLGEPLNVERCGGINVYFSGEDGPAIVNARAQLFDPAGRATRLMFQRNDFGEGVSFSQFLNKLHKIPRVPIVVIDPARKYLTGDEDDSSVVSDFFEAIEEFAIRRNAAVVVVHHLAKGAYPKSARETLDMLRGSQVFIDRPRVVIGMFRDGPYTIAGLAKNNIPPNLGMVTEERVFARNPSNLQLLWLPGKEGVRPQNLSPEELEELTQKAASG